MILRPYQIELIKDIQAALEAKDAEKRYVHRSVCAVLPTGGGKTVCFSSLAQALAQQGGTTWALAHREELVDQMSEKFTEFGVAHGLIKSGMPLQRSGTMVGMIQTACNKLSQLNPPDLLVIDECHHTPASQYEKIIKAMPPETQIIGFTATPCRLDGKGLGNFFDVLVEGPSTAELISMGYLCPPRVWRPQLVSLEGVHTKYGDYDKAELRLLLDEPTIIGDCVEHYIRIAPGTTAAYFCVDVGHAIHVAEGFRAAGIQSSHIDGSMPKPQRKDILRRFEERELLVLTSADLISEGFDCPGIETVGLLRPTKSFSLYKQQVGRSFRLFEGKLYARIIDHVRNTIIHGHPTAEVEWSLAGKPKREKDTEGEIDVKTCSVCHLSYTERACPDCKAEERPTPAVERKKIKEVEGTLVEVEAVRNFLTEAERLAIASGLWSRKEEIEEFAKEQGVEYKAVRDALIRQATTLPDLQRVGKMLGYDEGWAVHRYGNSWRKDARRHN